MQLYHQPGGRAAGQSVLPHPGANPLPLVAGLFAERTSIPRLVIQGGRAAGQTVLPHPGLFGFAKLTDSGTAKLVGPESIGFPKTKKNRSRWSPELLPGKQNPGLAVHGYLYASARQRPALHRLSEMVPTESDAAKGPGIAGNLGEPVVGGPTSTLWQSGLPSIRPVQRLRAAARVWLWRPRPVRPLSSAVPG